MAAFDSRDPNFEAKVSDSFRRQSLMAHIGAELATVKPGFCEIKLPHSPQILQQHGFFHGGVIGTIADSAGGYAAFSLMGPDDSVLTVEYKLNIVAPGKGDYLLARGTVIRSGRTLTVSGVDVFAVEGGVETLCATAQQTLMRMAGRKDDLALEKGSTA